MAERFGLSEGRGGGSGVVYANGGEEHARASRERVRETRGRVSEDERGMWGSRGIPGRLQDVGSSRRWPACGRGRRPRAPRPSGGRRTTTGSQSAGPSQVGWASTGKAQVASLSLFFYLFLFFYLTANVGL